MYNILNFINKLCEEETTTKEIVELTGLSKRSVQENLSRLVKIGYLERKEIRTPPNGRRVTYRLTESATSVIKNIFN